MTKTQNIAACVGIALASAIAFRSAFWKSDKTTPVLPDQGATLLAQNNPKPTQAANQTVAAASPAPVTVAVAIPVAQPVKSPPAIAENDVRTAGDGKEVLPPVGMLIPSSRRFAVDPANGEPATEFLNKNKSSSNQLLDPPNPENVDGPVVSPETK